MNWRTSVRRDLSDPFGPHLISSLDLELMAKKYKADLSTATLRRLPTRLEEEGAIRRVRRGLWINTSAVPAVQMAEAAASVRTGAIVSLQTVLGDTGVLNNPSATVTAIIPLKPGKTPPLGEAVFDSGARFRFRGLPERLLLAGKEEDRLVLGPYPRATPEASLIHWLLLIASPRSTMVRIPPDCDFSLLDRRRLMRLAKAVGIANLVKNTLQEAQKEEDAFDGVGVIGI